MLSGVLKRLLAALVPTVAALAAVPAASAQVVDDPCGAGGNRISCENSLPGRPSTIWDVVGSGDPSIQGFASPMSVNRGERVDFKVDTDATQFQVEIYRIGYYSGNGARRVAVVNTPSRLTNSQPACQTEAGTGLIDCGNWSVSASWNVPAGAVSGVYIARLIRLDTLRDSHVMFVVRDDGGASDILVQLPDTTYQAYNTFGGNSLYTGNQPTGRAYKVSYNRPFQTRETYSYNWFFSADYPLVRFLEKNGYDVSYTTGADVDRNGSTLTSHKVFLSSGHDEYWSGQQRANVEAARDAGVNLAFLSGNEIYWKTRWENGLSGSRDTTLVSYKETRANAKIDPSPTWTGTWRDARFSPPSDGGKPENALTGTSFIADTFRSDAIDVSAAEGKLRFWRDTRVATQTAGTSTTIGDGALGYEWDTDPDNGFRPPGQIRMSSTTKNLEAKLMDEGNTFEPGSATHYLTLYKAASGALVFGAGMIQWAWGLDETHDNAGPPADPVIQQATINLFADMGAQPSTLDPALVRATKSADSAAPTTAITSPTAGQGIGRGDTISITGTATEAGGGAVGGVEVSTDGGATWHPAQGREIWSYSWKAAGYGDVGIKARATDDSGNTDPAPAAVTVSLGACPCSIFNPQDVPAVVDTGTDGYHELGVRFRSSVAGTLTGVRFYKAPTNTGTHVGRLWSGSGSLLAEATFRNETASGWQQVDFDQPVQIGANAAYVVSYTDPNGHFSLTRPGFTTAFDNPPLKALADTMSSRNGVYTTIPGFFPTQTYQASNYWVDAVFNDTGVDTTAPTVESTSPANNDTDVAPKGSLTVRFSELVNPDSLTASTFRLEDSSGTPVPARITVNGTRATLKPNAALATSTTYAATLRAGTGGVTDLTGNALAADHTWTFTSSSSICPCTVFDASDTPAITDTGDGNAYEMGMKFTSDIAGRVRGVRFFKATANTGTHVGRLWSASGTLLGSVTFTDETGSGWQQALFDTPIQIGPNKTYVVSYSAPNGHYSMSRPYFGSAFDNAPLHALANGASGGNGVYADGVANFPSQTFQASNYWLDVVFSDVGGDTTAPTLSSTSPAANESAAHARSPIVGDFNEAIDPDSVTSTSFLVRTASGTLVPGSASVDGSKVSFRPTAHLSTSATYTAMLRGGSSGIKDLSGNAFESDHTWSFTVSDSTCPCTVFDPTDRPAVTDSGDGSAYELGMRFWSDVQGTARGVRFYKAAGNTGTHVGRLWTASGALLASVTFTDETPSGWQEARFSTPVQLGANKIYVVSYSDPSGHFSLSRPFFDAPFGDAPLHAVADGGADGANGVYADTLASFPTQSFQSANYWVDVVFSDTGGDSTPPTVSSTSPSAGATNAPPRGAITATFDEPVDPDTVTSSRFVLRDAANATVPATVTTNGARVSLRPSAPLTVGTTYTAVLAGGSDGIKDISGNALASDHSWSFTVSPSCPCTLFDAESIPVVVDTGDGGSYELGVKFRSDVDGRVTGVRFYKAAANTGTHVGRVWSASGTQLGSVTFSDETASGWQQAMLATSIPVTANQTYVVSYSDPNGHFSLTRPFFDNPFASPPLHAISDGTNGVFAPAPAEFPTQSFQAGNYWVDLVFETP